MYLPINGKKICFYILYVLSQNKINASLVQMYLIL